MSRSVLPSTSDLQLQKHSLKADVRKVLKQEPEFVEMTPQMLASVLFDQACIRAGKKNLWIASTLGVSESLVSRWRKAEHREGPSLEQVLALGADFQHALSKEQEKYHGWGRKALVDLLSVMGIVVEAFNDSQKAVGE